MKKKKIIIIILIIILILISTYLINELIKDTNKKDISNTNLNKINNNEIKENINLINNHINEEVNQTLEENNQIDEEATEKNEINEKLDNKEKAIEIVKKAWGEDDDLVKFEIDKIISKDEYRICVRNKITTRALFYYTVNIQTKEYIIE